MPCCETRPIELRTPTRALLEGGRRIEAQVSEPVAASAKLAATAAAEPELEPPGSFEVS